ncbi:MAG TPA: Hpt domain-containing protein [Sphingobium sp.]|nr:Hpt domain-containing protein [Sphingobium sp.]
MSHFHAVPLVDDDELAAARATLGAALPRIMGYLLEDGPQSIARIEEALSIGDAAMMVRPAHMLKGEARQLGCRRLGDLAETIEHMARRCVDMHEMPTAGATDIAMLRDCFDESLAMLQARIPASPAIPPIHAAPARRAVGTPANGARVRLFGRRTPS